MIRRALSRLSGELHDNVRGRNNILFHTYGRQLMTATPRDMGNDEIELRQEFEGVTYVVRARTARPNYALTVSTLTGTLVVEVKHGSGNPDVGFYWRGLFTELGVPYSPGLVCFLVSAIANVSHRYKLPGLANANIYFAGLMYAIDHIVPSSQRDMAQDFLNGLMEAPRKVARCDKLQRTETYVEHGVTVPWLPQGANRFRLSFLFIQRNEDVARGIPPRCYVSWLVINKTYQEKYPRTFVSFRPSNELTGADPRFFIDDSLDFLTLYHRYTQLYAGTVPMSDKYKAWKYIVFLACAGTRSLLKTFGPHYAAVDNWNLTCEETMGPRWQGEGSMNALLSVHDCGQQATL